MAVKQRKSPNLYEKTPVMNPQDLLEHKFPISRGHDHIHVPFRRLIRAGCNLYVTGLFSLRTMKQCWNKMSMTFQ